MPKGVYLRTKPVWNKGLTCKIDSRVDLNSKAISVSMRGIRMYGRTELFLKNGYSVSLIDAIKDLPEYDRWKRTIRERDGFTCQMCFERKHNFFMHAHHEPSFKTLYEEFLEEYSQFSPIEDKETLIRLAIRWKPFWEANGICLCVNCHPKREKLLIKKGET